MDSYSSPIQPSFGDPIHRMRRRIDFEQLKFPLGLVRVVELLFALIVLAASSGWEFEMRFSCQLPNKQWRNRSYISPGLDIDEIVIMKCDNNSTDHLFPDVSVGIGPGFYSYLTVGTLIFTVTTILLYVFSYAYYASDDRFPSLDLSITTIFAFGWLFGTLLFSIAVGRIEDATSNANVQAAMTKLNLCDGWKNNECKLIDIVSYAMYSPLSVAVLGGCALVLLFFANIWFCYKETNAFRARHGRDKMLHQMDQDAPYTLE